MRHAKTIESVNISISKLQDEDRLLVGQALLKVLELTRQRIPRSVKAYLRNGQPIEVLIHPLLKQNKDFRRQIILDLLHRIDMIGKIKFSILQVEAEIAQSDSHKLKLQLRTLEEKKTEQYQLLKMNVISMTTGATRNSASKSGVSQSRRSSSDSNDSGDHSITKRKPLRALLRNLINTHYPIDSSLTALAMDRFPLAHANYTSMMDRTEKVNYIFSYYKDEEIKEILNENKNAK